jgi:NADH-quinone oxidoreductase subunit G
LTKTQSVDVMDAVGSSIRVDTRGREVMRIVPRVNEALNEEWISDKTRHIVDGLRSQRLDRPYIRANGKLRPASWGEAFGIIAQRMAGVGSDRVAALAGDLAGVEEMFALKQLLARLGSHNVAAPAVAGFDPAAGRATYLFNPTIAGIEQADCILIVGCNPRWDAPVLNARIRKRWRSGEVPIGVIGEAGDLTYKTQHLGAGPETLGSLAEGGHSFAEGWRAAKRPLLIIGSDVAAREDGVAVLALAAKVLGQTSAEAGWNGFAVLHRAASSVGALNIGFAPSGGSLSAADIANGKADIVFSLGADEVDIAPGAFVIYIGTHGDRGAHRADVILPGAAYTEKSAIYVNTEGRVQITGRAAFPPGDAREDWSIIRALSDVLGHRLPYDSHAALRQALFKDVPELMRIDQIASGEASHLHALAGDGALTKTPFRSSTDFYMSNPIARASAVMAECARLAAGETLVAAE